MSRGNSKSTCLSCARRREVIAAGTPQHHRWLVAAGLLMLAALAIYLGSGQGQSRLFRRPRPRHPHHWPRCEPRPPASRDLPAANPDSETPPDAADPRPLPLPAPTGAIALWSCRRRRRCRRASADRRRFRDLEWPANGGRATKARRGPLRPCSSFTQSTPQFPPRFRRAGSRKNTTCAVIFRAAVCPTCSCSTSRWSFGPERRWPRLLGDAGLILKCAWRPGHRPGLDFQPGGLRSRQFMERKLHADLKPAVGFHLLMPGQRSLAVSALAPGAGNDRRRQG